MYACKANATVAVIAAVVGRGAGRRRRLCRRAGGGASGRRRAGVGHRPRQQQVRGRPVGGDRGRVRAGRRRPHARARPGRAAGGGGRPRAAGAGARHARHRGRHARTRSGPATTAPSSGSRRRTRWTRSTARARCCTCSRPGCTCTWDRRSTSWGRTRARSTGWSSSSRSTGWASCRCSTWAAGWASPTRAGDIELEIEPSLEAICAHLTDALIAHGLPMPELVLEPGRSIVGPAGTTLYRVGSIKRAADGTDLRSRGRRHVGQSRGRRCTARATRPSSATGRTPSGRTVYTIAGKHCESGDVLIERVELPELHPGDLLAVPATGAYNASMASTYNQLPRPAAVMVVRRRGAAGAAARDDRGPAGARGLMPFTARLGGRIREGLPAAESPSFTRRVRYARL